MIHEGPSRPSYPRGPDHDYEQERIDFCEDPNAPTPEETAEMGYPQFMNISAHATGVVCMHPGTTWFRDPRPKPITIRSRRAILAELLTEHGSLNAFHRAFIARVADDPDLPKEEASSGSVPPPVVEEEEKHETRPGFPQFGRLPAELRQMIWSAALPSRQLLLSVQSIHYRRGFAVQDHVPMPEPVIASVCKEARQVVFREGKKIALYLPNDEDSSLWKPYVLGLFLQGRDSLGIYLDEYQYPIYDPPPAGFEPGMFDPSTGAHLYTVGTLHGLQSSAVVVQWRARPRYTTTSRWWGSDWDTGRFGWEQLRDFAPALTVVYVDMRGYPHQVLTHMRNKEEQQPTSPSAHEQVLSTMYAAQFVVDLYDDQRLAEVLSLDRLEEDRRPRYAIHGSERNGNHPCIGCQRRQWERRGKALAEAAWLHVWEDELDEMERREVFDPEINGAHDEPYNQAHPWVTEKLAKAPVFRPVASFKLYAYQLRNRDEELDWTGQ